MPQQIQLRRGTALEWSNANPVLASGEIGFETDTNKLKLGDGVTNWISLAYFGGGITLEEVQDNLGTSFLVAGTNITLTYDDVANTLTINASTGTGTSDPLLQNGNQVKLVYRATPARWEFPDGTLPTLTGRKAAITWEGTAAQIPPQGIDDIDFKVGDTALVRSASL